MEVNSVQSKFIQASQPQQNPQNPVLDHKPVILSAEEKRRRLIQLEQKDAYGMTPKDVEEYRNLRQELASDNSKLAEKIPPAVAVPPTNNKQEENLQAENDYLRKQLAELQARLSQLEGVSTPLEKKEETSSVSIDGIELNEDFQRAIKLMEETNDCVFVTGKAGTGKSTLLRYFAKNSKKRIALLAYTGVAALHVKGETIHSFFGFPTKPISRDDIKVSSRQQLYRQLDAIIIDEASMVRSDIMDGIDYFMRLNGKTSQKPFGGVQLILFGDLYQLPPIVKGEEESKFFAANYRSEYFFDAHIFDETPINIIELRKIYRQKDQQFIDVLNAVRVNNIQDQHLQTINRRYSALAKTDNSSNIILTTRNEVAYQINRERLERLPIPEHVYQGLLFGETDKEKNLPAEVVLRLRKGAQVMFVKNDMQGRWVNGTLGRIHSLDEKSIQVEISSEGKPTYNYSVERETWEFLRHKYDPEKHRVVTEVIGSFTQFPLKLAWAITIHKSQGLTFERVMIDLGGGAFAHGQTYVALSRCTSLNGITLPLCYAMTCRFSRTV